MAEAEAIASRIQTTAQIERAELLQRAAIRFLTEEAQKQENIESIISKALPEANDAAQPENVENDWIANFFDKCRLISGQEMQKLWARILAGEANSPGRFSKRTVALLANMDKSDATKFSKVCDFSCNVESELVPVIFDFSWPIYAQYGLNYPLLSHLDTIGLIRFDQTPRHYFVIDQLSQHLVVHYFDREISINFPSSPVNPPPGGRSPAVGQVVFTDAGKQLANICEAKPVDGFVEFLKERWGFLVTPASPGPLEANKTLE